MDQKFNWMILLITLSIISCSQPVQLKYQNLYTSNSIATSYRLGGPKIMMSPLLTTNGPDTSGIFSSKNYLKLADRLRPEFSFVSISESNKCFTSKYKKLLLASLYQELSKGDILRLQTADSLWANLCDPYLLVMRLTAGVRLKTFDHGVRLKFILESEIWSRDSMEVVWRSSVHALTSNDKITEQDLFKEAVKKLLMELPTAFPTYDSRPW